MAHCAGIGILFALFLVVTLSPPLAFGDGLEDPKEETPVEPSKRVFRDRSTTETTAIGPAVLPSHAPEWQRDALELQDQALALLRDRINSTDDDAPERSALLLRLAEMLWKQASFLEARAFESLESARELDDNGQQSAAREAQQKSEADTASARETREELIDTLTLIVEPGGDLDLEGSARVELALYYLALNLDELDRGERAAAVYRRLIRDFPQSQHRVDAYTSLASRAFSVEEDMDKALEFYALALQASAEDDPLRASLHHQRGWCHLNNGDPKRALAEFQLSLENSQKATGRFDIRREALRSAAFAYASWDEASPSKAVAFFRELTADDDELVQTREALARTYQEMGRLTDSTTLYNQLIADYSGSYDIVDYQVEIMLNASVFTKREDAQTSVEELVRAVRLFEKAAAAELPGATAARIADHAALLEEYTRETAKAHHYAATVSGDPVYYALAYTTYALYFEHFAGVGRANASPEALYDATYFFAELLYWKKNFAEAGDRYMEVLDLDSGGKYSRDAAYGAVLAYNKVTQTPSSSCPLTPVEAEGDETFPEHALVPCRTTLITACDRYASQSHALPPGEEDPKLVDIEYTAARIFYDYNHFDEAVPRLVEIAQAHSKHRLAPIAANLALDSLAIRHKTDLMWTLVRDFKGNPDLYRPPLADVLDPLEEELAYSFCGREEEAQSWIPAARCYERFVATYPSSVLAPAALWSASVDWENASEVDKAIEARIWLLKEHGQHDLAARALYSIGASYHGLAIYSEAARFYELFVETFPDDHEACVASGHAEEPCAKLALQNAAAFRAGLGQVEEAAADTDLFVELFSHDVSQAAMLKLDVGRLFFDSGDFSEAARRYEDVLDTAPRRANAHVHVLALVGLGRANTRLGSRNKASAAFENAEKLFTGRAVQAWLNEDANENERRDLNEAAAEARFMLGEFVFQEAVAIQLYDPDLPAGKAGLRLSEQLKKKAALMQTAEPLYLDVVRRYDSPKWGLAALARLGMMYHDVASQIQASPCPSSLNEEQCLLYEELLIDYGISFEEKAIAYYVMVVDKAVELGWFSKYTALARRRLFDLRPDGYRSASEILAQPGVKTVKWQHSALCVAVSAEVQP